MPTRKVHAPVPEAVAIPGEEQVSFVADARLISVLGEQLIGSEKVGVLELIKNAYDAGASVCEITLEAVPGLSPDERKLDEYKLLPGPIIEVRDNGCGMDRETIVNGWLRPATILRASVKKQIQEARTKRDADVDVRPENANAQFDALLARLKSEHGGRIPLGEKGIGRLATHRLGLHLWLRTKTASDPLEWELKIDWAQFEDVLRPTNLSDVSLTLKHQPCSAKYGAKKQGTIICCYGGRPGYEWSRDSILELGRAVSGLCSPHHRPSGFAAEFSTPYVDTRDIASPLDRVPAPFELTAMVDKNGEADIEVRFAPPNLLLPSLESFKHDESKDLRLKCLDYWKTSAPADSSTGTIPLGGDLRTPVCGGFILNVKGWVRQREWLGADYKTVIEYLDVFGGISIFRDGLSALPAQQTAKGDWLGLAMRQIKKSSNISYYHMIGALELAQEVTCINDKTSREGMIETRAYHDLVQLTRALVDELQFHMLATRSDWGKRRRGRGEVTVAGAQKDLRAAAALARGAAGPSDAKGMPVRERQEVLELASRLESLAEEIDLLRGERDGLLEAAGFGLAVGVAVHEIAKLASAIAENANVLADRTFSASDRRLFEALKGRADALHEEVTRLAPLRCARTQRKGVLSVKEVVEAAIGVFRGSLAEARVEVLVGGKDFSVRGRFGALSQVFANLIDNAIYWCAKRKDARIQITLDAEARTIGVRDNGPGISKKMRQHLFEAFYSEKSPPSGLGLYICRFYLAQSGATIAAEDLGVGEGAGFVIAFGEADRSGE